MEYADAPASLEDDVKALVGATIVRAEYTDTSIVVALNDGRKFTLYGYMGVQRAGSTV